MSDTDLILVPVDRWLDSVRPEAPGAPNPLVRDRIVMAAIEFCKRTLVSRCELDPHDIVDNQPFVQLDPPNSCALIWRVLYVRTPSTVLAVEPRLSLADRSLREDQGEAREPAAYVQIRNDMIRLVPVPNETRRGTLSVQVALIPRPTADRIDERLWVYYREAITAGAISKVLMMKNTPWFDPNIAMAREREFQIEISRQVANTRKDEGVGDLHVTMRPFA